MQTQSPLNSNNQFNFAKVVHAQHLLGFACLHPNFLTSRSDFRFSLVGTKLPSSNILKIRLDAQKRNTEINSVSHSNQGELLDEDEDLCPVDCVKEFKTDAEFLKILDKAKETGTLVVVDFYRTSCGSCKYIAQGFSKLCKGSGVEGAPVIFLKHNVMDEYDEQSEVAERLRIKAVPLFHFYKNGVLLEAFPTRDKERIVAAIRKYNSS